MNLKGKRILLTGAAGGIGQPLALALAGKGAQLALVGRDETPLNTLCAKINQLGSVATAIVSDFRVTEITPNPAQHVIDQAQNSLGNIDILINSAGILDFTLFAEQDAARITQMMYINATVPILLSRALLPNFLARNSGHIVNIGSIFGSIGFPHYATYSASKFAVHGFTQALRRELLDSDITLTYIAPRAVKTPMNDQAVAMLTATKTAMDDPDTVVAHIIKAIETEKQEYYIGQPESFFAWLNGFLPSLVNIGLKQATRTARKFLNQ